ncbi:ATP-binding cassette sub-family A member 13 [Sorex fumeus]|uniref:ATP-binding cassette sub-family A member 13 n=1 Tax=Sorex fumeus TaxID=62283 RepID=UPI0024AD53E1|nr:ATP-binding cassette sub-family A member 13 [Sorex fumeus]
MGQTGKQFRALLWKNWLCRLRHQVLSLAEFFWPCILFMILTVLRFQEPPRHRETCYLQPRDLPSRGIFPFVQSLLCNTGSKCSNVSYTWSAEHLSRSSTSWTATDNHKKVNNLVFLKEIQDFAKDIYEIMDKAKRLHNVWKERSKSPDPSSSSSFLTMDLNKTEEVILKLESLHQQPYIWDFLLLLPRINEKNIHNEDDIHVILNFLQAVLNSLTSLEDLDWLPLNHTVLRISEIVLNVTISTLTFLQEYGAVAATNMEYNMSLHDLVWDPQNLQADLKSLFDSDDLHAEQGGNYSIGPQEVFDQRQKGSLIQMVLAATGHSLEALKSHFEEKDQLWKVADALHATLPLLNDSLRAESLKGPHTSPKIFLYLWKLLNILQKLSQWLPWKRLHQFDKALNNAVTQKLHFIREIFIRLQILAKYSKLDERNHLKLEKDIFFRELKQLLIKNTTVKCPNGHWSKMESPLSPENSSTWEALWGMICDHNSTTLNNLLGSVEDADYLLQEVITRHTNKPFSIPKESSWEELEAQLLEISFSCSRLFHILGAEVLAKNSTFSVDCKDQLISTVVRYVLEKSKLFLEQTHCWKVFIGFVRTTCEMTQYVNSQQDFQNNLFDFSEDSPCYKENMDWKFIITNYVTFLNNLIKSPRKTISRVLNSTKELLMMKTKLHTFEDKHVNNLLSFVEFFQKLLLPNTLNLTNVHDIHDLLSLTGIITSTNSSRVNHLKGLKTDLFATYNSKLLEFAKQIVGKIQMLERFWMKKESKDILSLMELIPFEINPKLLKFWMHRISKGERAKLENFSTLLNFSIEESERIQSKSFNFSDLFCSDCPKPTNKVYFVHLSENIINNLYEFGFLRQEQVSEALDIVYAMKNVSDIFTTLSEPTKKEIGRILTHIYLRIFKNKDSALLLKIYSSFYKYIYGFVSLQNKESLLSFFTQISKHILNIIKQFNFQSINKAFAFLYETARVIHGISDLPYCQKFLSIFNFLENQAKSPKSIKDPKLEVIYATLTGLKQLLRVDKDFRIYLFQYLSQFFNSSGEALLDNECFALDNKVVSSVNYSVGEESSFILPWSQILSNLSTKSGVLNEFMAIHCTISWLQMRTEIFESMSQIFKLDMNIFTPLRVGLTQLLEVLDNDMKISKSCQKIFPTHHPTEFILNLFRNVTQVESFYDWDDIQDLRDLWIELGDALIAVKSFNLDKLEKSLFTMKTILHQLKTFLIHGSARREFLYSLLDISAELSNTSEYLDRNAHLINNFLSNNHTNFGVEFENALSDVRETILFLRNVSHNQDLLYCADVFRNVTEIILENDLYLNNSQKVLYILSTLNSTFSSEDAVSRLKGCIAWVDIMNHLHVIYNSSFIEGHFQSIFRHFREVENKVNSTLKLVTWILNIKEPHCLLNVSDIYCMNIYLKNVTDFLNTVLTTIFDKEKLPNFEILLTLLNSSTNQVKMIISNLSEDFGSASQSNWENFTELILRPTVMSDEISSQFQNIWFHLVALGKEIQKFIKDISVNILEKNSAIDKSLLNIFTTRPKENDMNRLQNSFYHFVSYIAFNLSHNVKFSPQTIPHEVMKAVGLGIQMAKDMFNSLMPSVYNNIAQDSSSVQVLKKVTSLLHTFKKADIDLLVEQLEHISENLMDFFKNISRLDSGSFGINLIVDLMEKFVDSSHSWNVNHLLKLSRLLPKDDVNVVVDVYYMLPHAVRLLQRAVGQNITEVFKDVYNFTLLHGINILNVTKEDFAIVIKTLLDATELISDNPNIISEALICLPVAWCWNRTFRFQQNPKLETCDVHGFMSSSFYSKIVSIFDHLHLSPPVGDSQCSNKSLQMELTRKMVCVIHELVDLNFILLEVSEVFHVKNPLTQTVQEFWHKVLPFIPSPENQTNDGISEVCPNVFIKQVALQMIKKLKTVNFTNIISNESILDKLLSLNSIFNVNELNANNTDLQIINSVKLTLKQIKSEIGEGNFFSRSIVEWMENVLEKFFAVLQKKTSENKVFLLLNDFNEDIIAEMKIPLTDESVAAMCQTFLQPLKSPEALVTLQKVQLLTMRLILIFAENPVFTKDVLCAALSCKQDGIGYLSLSALQGVTLVYDHYPELEKIWSSPDQRNCEDLSRNLSRMLKSFKDRLENATDENCECEPSLDIVQQHIYMLIQSFGKTLLSGNPFMVFLKNFTITENIKVKTLMKNVTKLTEELQTSIHISKETIESILEANISHSQVLLSALTAALSGRCDWDILHLLLEFPKDESSWFAVKELCDMPVSKMYSLIILMSRNLNLRNVIYKTMIPPEASSMLHSLLDLISSLSHLLSKAGHILEYLPEFLHSMKITSLLAVSNFQQVSQDNKARSSAFGSFQSVMKMICRDQGSFLSNTNTFIDLPRVNELLEDDKEKFNIPEDSTPFCLKLYQEILHFPNGALIWSFLKPILHGKILYTPNTPEINKVIQKANYSFIFVDKLKALSETLLKTSNVLQSSGNDQMLNELQKVLRNKFIRNFIESQLNIDVDKLTEKLQTYGEMLHRMFNHTNVGHINFLGHILVNLSSCVALNRFQAMDSITILESKAHELMQRNNFLASIIFNNSFVGKNFTSESLQLPAHITYTIRTSVLYSMRTDLVKNPYWKFHPQSLPTNGFKYNYVFVPLQDMIERAIIWVQTGQEATEPGTQAQAIPYPCHTSDLFLNNVGIFFPLIMMLTWMVSVASMVRKLVYEREIQIEEYLKMMGVHPIMHFLAWFLENMAMLTLSSATLAVILKISGIFAHSNALIIFLFLLNFGVSVIMLSYFLSNFFNQANTAALCTSLIYMISFLPYIVLLILHNQLNAIIQTFLCLLSTTAFGQGIFFVTFLEGQETGIQWNNIYEAPEEVGMTFSWVSWMILLDSGLYFLCGWYLSNLIPGTFGLRKPWYFPFTLSYWKNICGLIEKSPPVPRSDLFFIGNFGIKGSSLQNGEGKLEEGYPGVELVSVTKEFENHKAIQNLTLTFYQDQITALLGTNGAGKTTVMSMLTGLYPPTSGNIIINGKDLQTDLSAIRAVLGVCPQRDVLFDNLTVLEHLMLFASIKAPQWTQKELQHQINKTLQDVDLIQHQHKQVHTLSGGMKRKLSIGIAFIGRSRTVILDEPTSGVDPCSRRSIWDILLKYREGRTVIFTTHHLDEAEALSDRVAVLQRGLLHCCGPPFCLTEAFGQGFSLTLTKQSSLMEEQNSKEISCITSLIQSYIPQAFLKDTSGCELTYTIPRDVDRIGFKGLFQALDQNLHHLYLTGYGISDTTLEEVFLMLLQDTPKQTDITPESKLEVQSHKPKKSTAMYNGPPVKTPPNHGGQLLLEQMAALFIKRLLRTLRAWKWTLSNLMLPVLFVALAMGLFMVRPVAIEYPPLKLTPGHYESTESYFFSNEGQDTDLAQTLLKKFGDQDLLCADLNPRTTNSSCWHIDPFSQPQVFDSCGCLQCPNRSAKAPYLVSRLGHTLLNLSSFNLEDYLLMPHEKPRLGGWSFGVPLPDKVEDSDSNISKPKTLEKVWYNQKGFHSLPSYLNHLNNLIYWRFLPPVVDWRQYGITLYSHPYGGALLNEDKILESIRQCGVALCIVLGFSILSASIGSSVVRDRVTGAKRLQHISGLGYRTYWFTNFLYDMLFYLASVCLCVAVIVAFQLTAFTFRENLAATALLLALFGYATLPWMYLMSRIFSSSDVAFISYVSLNFIFGLCTMMMTIMPRLLAIISKSQNLQNIYEVLKWVFTIFPQFCLGQGLIELCYNQIKYDLTHNFGLDSYVSPFEMNFLGWIYIQLVLQGTIFLILRILLHWDLLQRSRGHSNLQGTVTSSKDIDVEKEQMRVLKGRTEGDILVLCNLSKSYQGFLKRTTAVQDISLGVGRGECFGLLGANGAGKTTTFKMLNGDISPTAGHAVIRTSMGEDVDPSCADRAGIRIGYCPQQDALDELLTGWEHLRYYCSLRGIPKSCIPEVAGDLVQRLHLEAHVDKPVGTYSGGTKRKLSTALALLGKPDLLLLDEPSSGMDPCSKRYLWKTIMKEVREGCAAVLTSHSMEECEALCTRLAIMINGSFRCLGSPQHIKNRFGDGFIVRVWLSKDTDQHSNVSDCLKLHFPGIQFKGQRLNLLEYHVPKRWACLADLFKVLETNKTSLSIKYYSINQTTLEQVFINFASEQQQTPPSAFHSSCDTYQSHHVPI